MARLPAVVTSTAGRGEESPPGLTLSGPPSDTHQPLSADTTVKIKITSRASHARSPLPFFSIEIIIILITRSNGCISRLSSNFLRRPRPAASVLAGRSAAVMMMIQLAR